mmetsp:Transcript_17244/g.21795  ORF Transcript_17244/g.21795 Transcript_17244/m.21795 type:complete len:247 (+) Transcript_17244:121-861(+)
MLLSALDLNMKNANVNNQPDKGAPLHAEWKPSIMTIQQAKDKIMEYHGTVQQKDRQALQRRITFTQQAMLLLNRPEFSTAWQTTLKYKLRHWVKTKWVVHDLHKSGGRDLRCNWYKEHINLDDDFDDFSFASMMATRELEHFLSLDGISQTDSSSADNQDTQYQMLERNDYVQEWVSLGDQAKNIIRKEYVRIVDAKSLISGRQEWNRKRKQEANNHKTGGMGNHIYATKDSALGMKRYEKKLKGN